MKTKDKYLVFDKFYKKAKPFFRYIQSKDNTVKELTKIYGYHITPGSRNGGLDKRIVEIFWGNRPFDRAITVRNLNVSAELLTEHGATLHYHLLDNGNVIVSLYPAWTDKLKPLEENIFIDYISNPNQLLKINRLKKHWKSVRAYMNITSLEGNQSLLNKIRVWHLRNFKEIIVDQKLIRPKVRKVIGDVLKYVVTVGLSGFILMFISSYQSNQKVDKTPELLGKIITNQEIVIEKVFKDTNLQAINVSNNKLVIEINKIISKLDKLITK